MNLFYMQDSRSYVGNDVLWWAKNGNGYTTDLRNAETYTKDQAQQMHNSRRTDVPWPKDYIDAKTRPAVDMQYIDKADALKGTGVNITPEPKPKKGRAVNCIGCGRFLTPHERYASPCKNCGADNRP